MKYIREFVCYIPQFFKAVKTIFSTIPDFAGRGGKVFCTKLERPASGIEGKNLYFRTIIQPDGDIINIIPPITVQKDNKQFQNLYQKKYQEHYEKVRIFLTELGSLSAITKAISMMLSLTVLVIFNKGFSFDVEKQTRIYSGFALWVVITFLFHKFVSKHLFKIIVNLIIKKIKAKS